MNAMKKINREIILSYWLFGGFCILLISLKLTTILLTIFFSLLALHVLTFRNYKKTSIVLFLLLISTIFLGFGYFINQAAIIIPGIAENAIPYIAKFAQAYKIEIPFSDIESFKETIVKIFKTELSFLTKFARLASKEFIYLIIGIFIAVGMFITPQVESGAEKNTSCQNLYSILCYYIGVRCKNLFFCFKQVMGAQIIISLVNTFCTGIFISIENLPYFVLLIAFTFLCGLLPIIGNIISNSVIFFVASAISLKLAIHSLVFLVLLHKLEYFLNSKIIGGAIKNPLWLILFFLVIGERLIGIPGLILAPVFLRYIKKETQIITCDTVKI